MTEDGIYTFRVRSSAAGCLDSEAVDSPVYVKGKGEITGITINETAPTLKPGDQFRFMAAVLTVKAAAAGDTAKSATLTVTIAIDQPEKPENPGIDESQNVNNSNGNTNSGSQDSAENIYKKSVLQANQKKEKQETAVKGAATGMTSKNKKDAVSDSLHTGWEEQPELTASAEDENEKNSSQNTENQENQENQANQITEKQNKKAIYVLAGVILTGTLAGVGGIAFYRFRSRRR